MSAEAIEYRVTREQCEAQISGVCPGCGGTVGAIETVDNADNPTHWSGCEHCCVFTEGVSLEIHQTARKLVEEGTLIPYRFSDRSEPLWLESQTRGAASIVRRVQALLDGAS